MNVSKEIRMSGHERCDLLGLNLFDGANDVVRCQAVLGRHAEQQEPGQKIDEAVRPGVLHPRQQGHDHDFEVGS